MAKTERISLRATEHSKEAWQRAADADIRKLADWCVVVLDLVADSGLSVAQLKKTLEKT